MSQTSEEYWLQRKLADMARIYNFTEQRIRMLKRDYKLATKELQKLLRDGDVKDYEKKRFKQLLANIDSRLQILFELEAAYAERALSYAYEEEYYRGIFNIQQAVGYGAGTYYIAPDIVETAICTAWSGRSYSDRIWKRKKELGKTVEEILRKGMLMGHSNAKMSKKLAERMDVSLRQAARLIRTETCYVANQAALQSYKELEVEQYEFLATLDLLTSQTCRHLDGKKYPRDKAQVGLNYPPMHPHCRSTTIPVVDDFGIEGTRLARDADGKNYEVPKSIKYEDWYNQHVKTDPKYVLAEKKIKNKYRDQKQYEKYKEVLGKHAPKTFEEFQEIKHNHKNAWKFLKEQFNNEFVKRDFDDIPSFHGKCSDLLARKWYKWHDENIPNLIDGIKNIEEQARQACELRNNYRTQTRDLMKDQEKRRDLDKNYPNLSFEELLYKKMKDKSLTKDEAIFDILKTATKTNKQVNKKFGLE